MLCRLCPLLVTAINFFEELTAIFNGRSPNKKPWPAGESAHLLGKVTLSGFWADKEKLIRKNTKNKK
jgi:hypothetical protein